jgi:hypothetical protein
MSNPIPKPPIDPLFDTVGGGNPRHEVAACPTGASDAAQEIAAKRGAQGTADPSVAPSPGEGVTEEQVERSGLDRT